MELGAVSGRGYTQGSPGVKADVREKAEQNLARVVRDTLRISEEGRAKARERSTLSWLDEQIKSANDQAEAQAKEFKVFSNCQKIAARIMRGDKVDPKDIQYLMEHDSKGFQLAMAMRRPKKDPEDSKRITEDEEEAAAGADASGGASDSGCAPAPEAPPAPEAGGGGDMPSGDGA